MSSGLLRRALPPARRRALGSALGILADLCVVGLLALSMWLIVRAGEQPPILHLTFAIVGVRALALGRAAFRYAERLASHDAALAQLAELRTATYTALVPRVPGAIESHRRGEVLATFVDDVDQLQDEPLRVRQPIVVSLVVVVASLVLLAVVSLWSALVLAAALAVSGGLAAWLSARFSSASDRELSAARAALTDALLERFAAAEVLAAFGAEAAHRERIRAAEERLSRAQLRRSRSAGTTGALLSLGSGLASVLILLALSPALGEGLTGPLFAAAVVVPTAVFEVFAQLLQALVARRTVAASAERIATLTEGPLPAEIPVEIAAGAPGSNGAGDPGGSRSSPARRDASAPMLAVRGLTVRHPGAARPAISGLDFDVHAGEALVVSGESGSGKTTLALALVRLLDYRGSYRLRGAEARSLPISEVRATVGLCEQTPHLFDAELRQNLWFARDTATDDELMAVLDRVGLADWARARGGLDAPVGERGALVSGGQAQRIALARVLLADFPVVVLDEPTAGVDRELADRLLTDLLAAVPDDRAVILITHTDLPAGIPAARLEL